MTCFKLKSVLIVMFFLFLIVCLNAIVLFGFVRLRGKSFDLIAHDKEEFSSWSFADYFVIPPPFSSKEIKAIVYPSSGLFNANYLLDHDEFVKFCEKNHILYYNIKSDLSAPPFRREGPLQQIKKGYFTSINKLHTDTPHNVSVNIWYDEEKNEVLYRQARFRDIERQ